jgi:hypothetical protein
VLAEIISGRPLKSISMSLSLQSDAKDALDSLCLGSCPVKRLTLMSFVTMDPGILFREVAERIPELEALHLILMSLYTLVRFPKVCLLAFPFHIFSGQESLRLSGPVLTAFKSLKYITFMAYVRPSSIADNDERDIAQLWHRSCPTLQTIILPKGNVWFEQEGNWTPLDM